MLGEALETNGICFHCGSETVVDPPMVPAGSQAPTRGRKTPVPSLHHIPRTLDPTLRHRVLWFKVGFSKREMDTMNAHTSKNRSEKTHSSDELFSAAIITGNIVPDTC